MAETWCKAFGRYLRTLRQRRGLSLQQVSSLSQAFAERVEKGYLSRCENGFQSPSFSKIIPLARIYEVPSDVLLERLELDMELDSVGGPNTEGVSRKDLTAMAATAMDRGYSWHAYAMLRDAVPKAATEEITPTFQTREEQVWVAHMNCATAARRLGRQRFALHEFIEVEKADVFPPQRRVILFDRLSVSYRTMGQLERATEYGLRARATAESLGEPYCLGIAYATMEQLAMAKSDLSEAEDLCRSAYKAYQEAQSEIDCCRELYNLAKIYFDRGNLKASRRAVAAAEKTALRLEQPRVQVLSRLLLGEIDSREDRQDRAEYHWKQAVEIAKRLDDKILRFRAEFLLYRHAEENGNAPVARSLQRRLLRLSHWIPGDTEELVDFKRLQSVAPTVS